MQSDREPNWYSLNMLPLYVEMCDGQLESSLEQFNTLKMAETKPHVLDDALLQRIVNVFSKQNEDTWIFFEQCKKWRDMNPDNEQLKQIAHLEKTVAQLETTNHEILTLAQAFQGKTINNILAKDDFEVGMEWLKNLISQ